MKNILKDKLKNKMDSKNALERLAFIKTWTLILLMVAVTFIALEFPVIIAILIISLTLYWDWTQYRCPHCKGSLDMRMKINDYTHCPLCGKVISVAKKPS